MLSWIVLFPLLGFALNGVWYAVGQMNGKQKPAPASVTGVIASVAIFMSFVFSLLSFIQLTGMAPESRVLEEVVYSWFTIGKLNIDVAFRADSLSILFCLVISGVGTLIHVYSIGYMSHDETPGKYFAYLNLFCFAMLVLVLGANLPIMFLGWEGVGLCSYLLIGYWYTDIEKASAGKKAFVVNRIGDLGFLLGMFLVFSTFGTLDFAALREMGGNAANVAPTVITAICVFFFIGCTGKSAQIPLYVWLPDAMAGPTPVSALIHAATMVTSGIYLVARLSFLYTQSPDALMVVAWVGALTALFAATMAIAQNDIKKVLAYSTVSQLGYMFLACGVGAYDAGVFHVITHAFFKALLFLGAGSVIFGMHHEQDVMKMGGLKSKMPQTYLVFLAGWLAICGIPPFSGFFSKDEILWKAFSSPFGSKWLWAIGAVTAVLTAFYMTRLFSLTFLGKNRTGAAATRKHPIHESPKVMVYPLMVLAALSVVGGFMGIPHISWISHWLEPSLVLGAPHDSSNMGMELLLMVGAIAGAAIGIGLGLRVYRNFSGPTRKVSSAYQVLKNKYYVDELYEKVFVKPIYLASRVLWQVFDDNVIDRIVIGFGRVSAWTGQTMRVVQTGSVQVYATGLLFGLLVTLVYLIYGIGG